jgi:WD repeat-containing protein 35
VKVVKSVKVFHVPKHEELDLEGLQGTFVKDVTEFKGQTLSANLPIKVAFQIEKDGATVKFQAHLVSGGRGAQSCACIGRDAWPRCRLRACLSPTHERASTSLHARL